MALRVKGKNFLQIAGALGVPFETAVKDVTDELLAMCNTTRQEAEWLRELELERADRILRGLSQGIEAGDPPACRVALCVAEHRCKLLGIYRWIQTGDQRDQQSADLSERETALRIEALVADAKDSL